MDGLGVDGMMPAFSTIRSVFWAVCAAVLLNGCVPADLQPVAKRLDPSTLQAGQTFADVDVAARAWPQARWWTAAHDAQLDALVDEAVAHNPDMTVARARVRAAMAAAGIADAARQPDLTGGASISGARLPPMLPPIASGHYGTMRYAYLHLKWDLDLWGGKRAAWQEAVGEARAAAIDAEAARLQLSADVVQAYFDLGAAYVLQDLAQEEQQRAQDFLSLTRSRVKSGIESRLALAQIEAETARDRSRLEAARNTVRTDALVLAALLGAGPDRALTITRPPLPAVPALALPSRLPADLLGRRPDVVAARWRVEAASRGIEAAKAEFLPDVSISALAGLISPTQLDFFSLQNRFYQAGPALSLPIFEGGALRANLSRQDAARDMAVAHYNQTLIQAISQVAIQVDELRSLAIQVDDSQVARDQAQQAYGFAQQRFRDGVGSFLESLTQRQQLIIAEQQLAAAEVARVRAWVQLNEALGGGFQPPARKPATLQSISHESEANP